MAFFVPLTSTLLIFLPTTSRSRSRRITSTSGSSIRPPPHGCLPGAAHRRALVGLARGVLLRFLLGASDARAERLARHRHDGRRELLLVVRPVARATS